MFFPIDGFGGIKAGTLIRNLNKHVVYFVFYLHLLTNSACVPVGIIQCLLDDTIHSDLDR